MDIRSSAHRDKQYGHSKTQVEALLSWAIAPYNKIISMKNMLPKKPLSIMLFGSLYCAVQVDSRGVTFRKPDLEMWLKLEIMKPS